MKKRIIISDVVDPRAVEVLQNEGYEVRYIPNINTVELKEMVRGYNGLIVRSDTKVTADIIAEMDQMEVIGRAGSGITNIDVEAATRKGIVVMNTPGGNTISTAEHTMSLLLSMCRNIPQADHSMKDGKWERKKYRGMEIHGKTLGIFGLGKVGKEVAARALGFGMIVIGYDPILSEDIAAKLGIRLVEIAEVFKQSDIITVHVPLDERTANLIRKETLALCKPGVKIINCARGGIINEEAMLEALNSGHVSAAAIDVYQTEPPDFTQPLFSHPSVVTTPHLCSSTDEAEGKVSIQIAEQFIELFNNNKIIGAVNSTAIAVYNNPELAPFVLLAEKLGILIAQLIKGRFRK